MWTWPKVNKLTGYTYDEETIRQQLSQDCENKCVYCGIHESKFGGDRSFQIDHFRPKSIERFKKLEFDYSNLFWSCCVCNNLKRADWPSDDLSTDCICYLDPSLHDYNLSNTILDNGTVEPLNIAMRYINERLGINRSYLVYLRRESRIIGKSKKIFADLVSILEKSECNKALASKLGNERTEAISLLHDFIKIYSLIQDSKPYEPKDVTRPNG